MGALNRLNHPEAIRLKSPDTYEDGGGLRLVVSDSLSKRWVMRLTINGKRHESGRLPDRLARRSSSAPL
jgi:hypothetical protein